VKTFITYGISLLLAVSGFSQTPAAEQSLPAAPLSVATKTAVLPKDYDANRILANRLTAEELPPLRDKALAGDVRAAVMLGTAYQLGCPGSPRDDKEALRWYTLAADKGSSIAANQLGFSYDPSAGFAAGIQSKNADEALKWFHKAAEQNDSVAFLNGGKLLIQMKRDAEAADWLSKALENGNATAGAYLADLYDRGKALPGKSKQDNHKEALALFQRLADASNAGAQFVMGEIYRYGWFGTSRNPQVAADYIRKAAVQEMPDAQRVLGNWYWDGRGVSKDKAEAIQWYLKAANQNDPAAQLDMALVYERGDGAPTDFPAAYMWYELAREGGAPGTQVPRTATEAGDWIRLHHRFTVQEVEEGKKRLREWRIEHGRMYY
jgi:uncharacterized protein